MRVLFFALILLSFHLAADSQRFQPEDVFALNWVSNPQVSADGSFVVFTKNFMDIMEDKRRSNLWRIDSNGSNARPITSGARNDGGAVISPDGARLAYVSGDDKGAQIFIRFLDSGETQQLTRLANGPGSLSWSPDGQWLAFTMLVPKAPSVMGEMPPPPKGAKWADPPIVVERSGFRFDGVGTLPLGFSHVFVVAATGGAPRQLTQGEFNHHGPIAWTTDSQTLYFSANRNENAEMKLNDSEIYRVDRNGGELFAVTDRDGPDGNVQMSPDGKMLAWTGYDEEYLSYQGNRLYVMNLDGSDRRELAADLDRGINDIAWASDSRGIYAQYDDEGNTVLALISLRGKVTPLADNLSGLSLSRPYSGAQFAVGGRNTFAYTAGDSLRPAELAIGRGSNEPRRVTNLNSNLLDHRNLAQVEEIWLKSSFDGADIQAWVAYPPDFDSAKEYPLLLEIHGGPHTTYGPHFAAEVQLFAAAGYVVVYANPRGSTSYGHDFANLIHHNYPSEDFDDLMSTVDAVIARGSIDTDRLYVTGGSGGGVLTAWIVGTTDRFRAAVVAKPVINWISFALSADMPPFFTQYWFPTMPWEDPMGYWNRSPLSRVGNVSTPTMLLSGEADWRTPMWEAEQYYHALKLRGIDTALVRIPGASHSIANRPSQLIAKAAAILAWFEKYP